MHEEFVRGYRQALALARETALQYGSLADAGRIVDVLEDNQPDDFQMAKFTLKEVAAILNVSERTLRRYLRVGLLTGDDATGRLLFSDDDLRRFRALPRPKSGRPKKLA